MFLISLILHAIYLVLLILILIFVLRLQSKKESFANCFGMQYNGLPFLENMNAPICPRSYNPLYREGGCVQYDPQKISAEYASGKHKGRWISAV